MNVDAKIAIASLAVSGVALVVSLAAAIFAGISVRQSRDAIRHAKQIADRERQDWKQQKWFDLYLVANEAHEQLMSFQAKYKSGEYSQLMHEDVERVAHCIGLAYARAMVFPVNQAITEFCMSTSAVTTPEDMLSEVKLKQIFDAVENLREKALIMDPTVLD
jgi:hypothetical protein